MARVSTRALRAAVLTLLVLTVAAVGIGLFLLRQPDLEPVPVPSVSRI